MESQVYKIETPNLKHAKSSDWEYIYEPAEDTFLLLDTIEQDLHYIYQKKPKTILEVGCGSGTIITALSKAVKSGSYCVAVDINEYACKMTKQTSHYNFGCVDVIQGDLTSCLRDHMVDLIIFNPPYVVTPSAEVYNGDVLTKSWAGGINGREIIDKFLNICPNVLSETSFGYLLVLKENNPAEIIASLKEKKFNSNIIGNRKIQGEELFVIKFVKTS